MPHNLAALSPLDFENLCADVLGADLSVRFELFAPGPDSGIDFRCQEGGVRIIGQAKHYAQWRDLRRAVAQERAKVEALNPGRYILCTSCALTPGNKDELLELLAPYCKGTGDIWGHEDIDAALGRYPQVLRRHVKLWLQDEAQLQAVLHNGLLQLSAARQAELQQEMEHFVVHPLIDRLYQHLQQQAVLLVSGAAGVGKTTACTYLSLQLAAADGYEFHFLHDMSSIKDVWSLLQTGRKQCFVMDDFLGATFLDPRDALGLEQELVTLLNKALRSDGNLKLLLATRDYVLSQAAERLPKLNAWLDVKKQKFGVTIEYLKSPIRSKADILYNLMFYSGLAPSQRSALVQRKSYRRIIEHRHFNPRLLKNILNDPGANDASDVHGWLLQQLNDPTRYWESTFLRLSEEAQCLLYTLALGPLPIDEPTLMHGFGTLYRNMHGHLPQPNALQAAVAELEPNLVSSFRHGQAIWSQFANPGVADLVQGLMSHHPGLQDVLISSVRFYEQGEQLHRLTLKQQAAVALTKTQLAELLRVMERCVDVATPRLQEMLGRLGYVQVLGEADHLASLWRTLNECRNDLSPADLRLLTEKLAERARRADWGAWCKQQSYGDLTDMALALLEGETLKRAVLAMIENIRNSQDALYMAQLYKSANGVPALTDHEARVLLTHIVAACAEEIDHADDEDHLNAILIDVEEIQELVSVDMDDVKYGAWSKLEGIERSREYEEDEEPDLESIRQHRVANQAEWSYVAALFERGGA
ncbi:MAG TPA: hypothetical protein VF285_11975 [Castellaniella sp.]|uniref:nSTAND3 domain-containing NTPase n=1 Tax=Castellaniella sp. TaxID=1955812 RepID=UPI002F0E8992